MMKNQIYPFWQTAGAAEYGLLKSIAVVFSNSALFLLLEIKTSHFYFKTHKYIYTNLCFSFSNQCCSHMQ